MSKTLASPGRGPYMLKRFSLILAVALSLPLSTTAPAHAQSYPLTCQIGTMNPTWVLIKDGSAGVEFQKAKGPASSGLQPGQCAWNDRAMSASEPNCSEFIGTPLTEIHFSGTSLYSGTA